MNRVVHFEIHAGDPERAARFYREAFGWDIQEWVIPGVQVKDENRYWVVTTGPDADAGIDGGIMFRKGPAPAPGQAVASYVCTIEVSSLDDSLAVIQRAGGSLRVPKMPIMGIGWLAYCGDTEGNLFGILQNDTSAR